MKKLRLEEVLRIIDGVVVEGKTPKFIRQVVDYPSDVEVDETLLFDRHQRIQPWRFERHDDCVVVTENPDAWSDISSENVVVRVTDVEESYRNFVRYYRGLFSIPVIAITGTCGKTTTKEMVAHILSKKYHVQSTIRSKNDPAFNSDYLLGIDDETDAAVFETAVGRKGDLLRSCKVFRPNLGVITNIGIDHLNKFPTHYDYIQAKGEMLPGLGYTGTLLLNADDANIKKIDLTPFNGRLITFGFGEQAEFQVTQARLEEGGMSFTLRFAHIDHDLFVPGYGKHSVYNAVAAIATAYAVGVGIDEAGESLRSYQHLPGHTNVLRGLNGSVVIDDTWSSNPTSMGAALKLLDDLAQGRKKIAVLGKMAALGEFADEQYAKISRQLVDQKVDVLITRNSIAKEFAKHAIRFGMRKEQVYMCTELKEIQQLLQKLMDKNTIVLVKTSMKDYEIEDLMKHITV
ncbi:Mur ligase family protein [Alicyclobacillus dauci]|uniref:UDP-N-acetylmuramoyl-tripeptide--D-alanyl-D-alanine ligase n=1 Tax=Alicyclobacillus dauci TaxID=1475485 RepID=A0ABY6Z1S9_9BACL|nr:UDP-N-acetylmuramoyl-tripeptide--D-alanyl-D-alanine ligase [Alicyclobacillus dauci]WAH36306.1 UDP-N-acetylmuramoyl-tripeptide--D-alanyl-D-alanine ligase [Alicyclobacillus dauci]